MGRIAALVGQLLVASVALAGEPKVEAAKVAVAKVEVVTKFDVPFAKAGGESLKLDFAAPKAGGPHPCVLCLHGGAWKAGSRKDLSEHVEWIDFGTGGKSMIEFLAANGFAAASASYRLVPGAKFPAQIQDVKTAIRYLRANAADLNIDPERIAVLGISAGGHLAALAGLTEGVKEFAGEQYPEQSSRVRCVVDFFGPADLTLYAETPGIEKAFMEPLLGGTSAASRLELCKKASPVEYATKDAPPFLILHGTADVVVPLLHSKRLHAKLTEAGASSELIPVRGKGHGWFGPDAARSQETVVKFLAEHLKAKP